VGSRFGLALAALLAAAACGAGPTVTQTRQPTTAAAASVSGPVVCPSGAISASLDSENPTGPRQLLAMFAFTNTGGSSCSLPPRPTRIDGSGPGVGSRTLKVRHTSDSDFALSPTHQVNPGQTVYLPILTSGGCAKSQFSLPHLTRLTFSLSSAVAIPARLKPFRFYGSCGAFVGKFAMRVVPITSPIDELVVTRRFPKSILADSTIRFTVTLTNPTGTAISLLPCPKYTEFVASLGRRHSREQATLALPCGTITGISPGATDSFQIQATVPDRTGIAKYGWSIPGTSLETGGASTIVN
jgi:hypothetical protein